ncbi:MAG TPA: hypothetical protein VLT82_05600 [Myxococcaceae bacterium]|nr:hypothetical protein [Myxococcaceae bacterium]
MHPVRTLVLLAALLPSASARAVPRSQSGPRPALEVKAENRGTPRADPGACVAHALRDLPAPVERPRADALLTRWLEGVGQPGPDGSPRLVLVMVRGGLGLAWARRW